MKPNNNYTLYAVLAWLLSVAVAYGVGWWTGVKNTTSVAAGAAQTGFDVLWIAFVVLMIVAAVAAFRLRGYFQNQNHPKPV